MPREEELQVLRMIHDGIISAEEGDRLLRTLAHSVEPEILVGGGLSIEQRSKPWVHGPLIAGSVLVAIGAVLLALAHIYGAWLARAAGIVSLGLGLLIVLAGLWLVRAAWLRVHIAAGSRRQAPLRLSLPVPLALFSLAMHVARPYTRRFGATGLDEAIQALRDGARTGQMLSLEVEGEGGDRVQLFIG